MRVQDIQRLVCLPKFTLIELGEGPGDTIRMTQ